MSRGAALHRIEEALRASDSRSNARGDWQCPAHEDRNPSLSVGQGESGAVVHCHAGCCVDEVMAALNLEMADLFDEPKRKPNGKSSPTSERPRVVARYVYTDRMGKPLARKVRYEPKNFAWEVANGSGWRLARKGEGNLGVLYRLPEVVDADHVHIGEGEKAADALAEVGHCATCPPTGCWTPELVEPLRGKPATLWVDRDAEGLKKARKAIEALRPVVKSLRVVQSKEDTTKADAYDHLKAGHAVADAVELDPASLAERDLSQRPRLLTADEFATDVAPEAIVRGLIYIASTTLLTGASKTGKTWFVLQLVLCVLAGIEFMGLKVRAGVVLLLSLELSAGMVRKRFEEMCHSIGFPSPRIGENLHVVAPTADYVPALDLSTEIGFQHLRSLIEQTDAQLVVLDTLYRFLPGSDPVDNKEQGQVFGRLNDLAQGTGAALLIVDHMGKGEHLGPISQSALGASVKGGAARVVAALKRTSKEDGGRWEFNVESHFGNWDEPLHFERPKLGDERRAGGCVLCTASEAHGLDEATIRRVFANHGERVNGRPVFASKRKLREALQAEKLASGNSQADAMVHSIVVDFCVPETTAHTWGKDRPIVTSGGPKRATVFTWRMVEPEQPHHV